MTPPVRAHHAAALLLLGAIWGASFAFIRVAAPVLGPFPLMFGRVTIAAAALWSVAIVRGKPLHLRQYRRPLLWLGFIHAAVPFALVAAAETELSASTTALLIATQPLLVALISRVRHGERVASRQVAGLLLGLTGVLFLTGWTAEGAGHKVWAATAATLCAAFCYAAGGIYTRRRLAQVPVHTLALGQQLAAAVWLLVPTLWTLSDATVTATAVTALLALALLSTSLAYLLFFWLIAEIGPVRAATVTYIIPAFGVFFGVSFLGEQLSLELVVGLACILGGLVLVSTAPVVAAQTRVSTVHARGSGPVG